MQVFRSAFAEHDARKAAQKSDDDAAQVTGRSKQRREGVSETTLREHIRADIASLLNTTQLDSAVSLEEYPHVASSVANFGLPDLSNLSTRDLSKADVLAAIRQSIIDHEPRMNPASVDVSVNDPEGDAQQRLAIHVTAELFSDPVDIPIDFEAEVDLGKGKLNMTKLSV